MSVDLNADLNAVDDAVLVERATDGDTAAFEVIIRRHGPLMRSYAYRILRSEADADDVVQDAFYTAWRQLSEIRDPAAVRSWLMRIVSRTAFTHLRRRPATETDTLLHLAVATTPDPETAAIRNAQLDALSGALDRLPEDQKQCWLLRELVSLSYTEIAQELHLTPGAVRGKLARARASVAIEMEEWR
ncbi:RNA polymerase sigma factor [Glaciibacter flavus]|uniref:RNA polymerase sigma factor n=1 Tax=Orlajensenia flava TaxID=2565934 RepID=A0A4S4FM73_9MICO|nr:RNA polymerase sigma factor [Glaciibacter flavus]THG30346.1 RNA polymerase sigma factor [Glaciibacter flavus]THG30609.1 RNA polymerase sigma factor [Glaciibacter flavus]